MLNIMLYVPILFSSLFYISAFFCMTKGDLKPQASDSFSPYLNRFLKFFSYALIERVGYVCASPLMLLQITTLKSRKNHGIINKKIKSKKENDNNVPIGISKHLIISQPCIRTLCTVLGMQYQIYSSMYKSRVD